MRCLFPDDDSTQGVLSVRAVWSDTKQSKMNPHTSCAPCGSPAYLTSSLPGGSRLFPVTANEMLFAWLLAIPVNLPGHSSHHKGRGDSIVGAFAVSATGKDAQL